MEFTLETYLIFKQIKRKNENFDISFHLLYNGVDHLGMYRFRQEILGHKQRVGIPSTPLNGGKT